MKPLPKRIFWLKSMQKSCHSKKKKSFIDLDLTIYFNKIYKNISNFALPFFISVSDNEPSKYVRKCPFLAKFVHARALWRHFFNHSRINKFFPVAPSSHAHFSYSISAGWVNSACKGKFCLNPNPHL